MRHLGYLLCLRQHPSVILVPALDCKTTFRGLEGENVQDETGHPI